MTVASSPGPAPLVRDVLLRDGASLRLLAATPADFEDISPFYTGLSRQSRLRRFHGLGSTDAVARAEANASGADRLALIGRRDGRVVAVGSYTGLREPGVAEVALAVADDEQGRGIGMRFVEQPGAIASQRGIHRFDAEVLESNAAMLRVFEHAGYAVRHRGSGGELTPSVDLTPTEALRERIDARDHGNPMVAQRLGEAKADLAESDEHDVMAGGSGPNTATSVSAAMMLITDRSLQHAGPASLVGASATVATARVLK